VTEKKYRSVDIKRASKATREVSKFYQDQADHDSGKWLSEAG
jgi:hypothetical protein